MAMMVKKRKSGSFSKTKKSPKNVTPVRRPLPVEAPDRGHLTRDREAPETREVKRVEAPDAGYGVPSDLEIEY